MCLKCGSLLISCDTSDRDGDNQMSEDCHDSNNQRVRDWAPQRATSVKSFAQVERLSSGIKHGDVTGDAALAEQLRAIDLTLKSLLRKNTLSDPECVDPMGLPFQYLLFEVDPDLFAMFVVAGEPRHFSQVLSVRG